MSAHITHERLLEVLDYDQETGVFTWKKQLAPRGKIGTRAGCLCKTSGYHLIRVDSRLYRANMLAWFFVTRNWPTLLVDHRDCDRSNDRFANLREASYSQNFQNAPVRKNNTSGLKGVCWCSEKQKWVAQICVFGERLNLGRYSTKEAAHKAYVDAANKHFGEFARVA